MAEIHQWIFYHFTSVAWPISKRWGYPRSPAPRVPFRLTESEDVFCHVPLRVSMLISKRWSYPTVDAQSLVTCRQERITNTYCLSSVPSQHPSERKCTDWKTPSNNQPCSRYPSRADRWDRDISENSSKPLLLIQHPQFSWLIGQWLWTFLKASSNKSIICFLGFSGINFKIFLKASSAQSI